MSECDIHQLRFGPGVGTFHATDVHWCEGKPADVVDLACPCCGLKLFVYYRTVPGEQAAPEKEE